MKELSFPEKSEKKLTFIFPVDTGRKLNVHKTFKRRPGRLWTSYVRSIDVLYLCGSDFLSSFFFVIYFIVQEFAPFKEKRRIVKI